MGRPRQALKEAQKRTKLEWAVAMLTDLVAQFRVAHWADPIWKGQQRAMRAISRSLQDLSEATAFPDWEAVQTLFPFLKADHSGRRAVAAL